MLPQLEVAHLVHVVHLGRVGAEDDLGPLTHHAVHHPDAGDGPAVAVVVGIEDERAQRGVQLSPRSRHPGDDRLEQLGHPGPLLGRDRQDLLPLCADQIHDLLGAPLRLGAGEVDLVEHRDDLESGIHRQKEIAQGLSLDALRGIDHQDCAFARGQGPGNLVGEVDVSRSVDQVELVARFRPSPCSSSARRSA